MLPDDETWRYLKDPGKVEQAAKEALQEIDRETAVSWAQLGVRRHAGAIPVDCDELWCVKIPASPTPVRECMAVTDTHADMVAKFVRAFRSIYANQ